MSVTSPVGLFYKDPRDLNVLALEDFAFGAAGSLISLSAGYAAMKGTEYSMEEWGLKNLDSQSYFRLYDSLDKISHGILRGVLKSFAVVYVAVLVPILEEWLFRDLLYKWQESEADSGGLSGLRSYRVIANGILFGAFHFSILQGWANIPIMVVSMIAGIVFAGVRELRGDRWASTVAHSLNNSLVLGLNFLRI